MKLREWLRQFEKDFIQPHRRQLALISALTLSLLFLFLIFSFAITTNTSLCQTCHLMKKEYVSLQESSHKDIICGVCHERRGPVGFLQGRLAGLRMTTTWLFRTYEKPIRTSIKNMVCLDCHANKIRTTFTGKNVRVSHKEFLEPGAKCTECHNTVAHGDATPVQKTPTLEKCTPCHNMVIAQADCEICHPKGAEKTSVRVAGSWSITHGPTWKKTHGMGDMSTCRICHEKNYCIRCHQIELPHTEEWWGQHGKIALANPSSCQQCHPSALCTNCHQFEMPHPASFLPNHASEVRSKGEGICYQCHRDGDCRGCHTRHIHRAVKF